MAKVLSIGLSALLGVGMALPLWAQSGTTRSGMADMHHAETTAISDSARHVIARVARASAALESPDAAAAAGFKPVFGWIPTMGVHWLNRARMSKEAQADALSPSNLMFSKIGGRDSLVGAAYAYFAPESDSVPPAVFDGKPPWHEHPNLAPPGERLVMLHVWFVASPDGPFAGTNPNLPFWVVGLDAPDSVRMHDPAFSAMVRRASLALAEVADTTAIFANLETRPDVHAVLGPCRDSVRALIPELRTAQQAKNAARWERAADRAARQWDLMYAAYDGTARTALGKQRIERFVAMLLGEHAH